VHIVTLSAQQSLMQPVVGEQVQSRTQAVAAVAAATTLTTTSNTHVGERQTLSRLTFQVVSGSRIAPVLHTLVSQGTLRSFTACTASHCTRRAAPLARGQSATLRSSDTCKWTDLFLFLAALARELARKARSGENEVPPGYQFRVQLSSGESPF
jgi:hypothetical protein